jgi:hypothetical protein
MMIITKMPEDALEGVAQGPGMLDARVNHQDREHVLVRHDSTLSRAS